MEAPILQCFNLVPTFFGFKPEHQILLHNQIFDLLWAGDGRWTFQDIYTMPLRIRKLWVSRINKMREEASDTLQQNKSSQIQRGPIKK